MLLLFGGLLLYYCDINLCKSVVLVVGVSLLLCGENRCVFYIGIVLSVVGGDL